MAKVCNGSPSEPLTVNLKESLLTFLDRYCQKTELSKSQVVSIALKSFLASEMAKDPAFWDTVYIKYEADGKL